MFSQAESEINSSLKKKMIKPKLGIRIDEEDDSSLVIISNEESIEFKKFFHSTIVKPEPMTEKKTTRFTFSQLKKPSELKNTRLSPISAKKGVLTTRSTTKNISKLILEEDKTTTIRK